MTKPEASLSKLLEPTIPSEFIFEALQAYQHKQHDIRLIIKQAGLDPTRLRVRGHRISVVDYSRLIERVIANLNDGFLGFLDAHIPVRSFSVFANQLAACTNIKQIIQQANRFYGLFSQQFKLQLSHNNEHITITLHFEETQEFDYRFIYQSILLIILRLIHWFTGTTIPPTAVKFSFNESHLSPYLDYLFGGPILYSQKINAISFPADLLQAQFSTNLDQIDLMLRDSQRMMLVSHKPAPFTRQVRQALVLQNPDAWSAIEQVAASMKISKNLLWRKLKKEGTTFLNIRDEVKRDLAITLISDHQLSIGEIAFRTGFTEVSAFNKAFKRWTSQSPSSFRKSLLSGNS